MLEKIHVFLFIAGSFIIWDYNHTENIGIIISFIFSFGAIMWNSYKFFDDRKWKKDLEKIKFLNQKNLEAYKLYIIKKNDNIIYLHEAISNALQICYSYQYPMEELFYDKFTKIRFYELFDSLKITNAVDQSIIISFWNENKDKPYFNTEMNDKICNIKYSYDSAVIKHMNHCLSSATLYLQDSDFEVINDLVSEINKFLILVAPIPKKANAYDEKMINEINNNFNKKIVPILKKALKDFDHTS